MLISSGLMILGYLTGNSGTEPKSPSQGDIGAALAVCTAFSRILVSRDLIHSASHELLLQSAANLLLHHARIGPFRPALIREHLTHFLNLFPQNSIFLSLYAWNESRLRIDNRVRNILQSTVLVPEIDTLTSRLFTIQYEIQRGTIHSVRSAFEHALSSPSSKPSSGLWRFYILYCLETQKLRTQAKDIWYRAIRACPWAKELYLIGFEKMSDMLPFSELKSIWRIMGEKDLRIHVDLEEKFEDIADLEKAVREKRNSGYR
jgi:nuclear exosome regulator NRDE2